MNKNIMITAVLAMLATVISAFSVPAIYQKDQYSPGFGLRIKEVQFDKESTLPQTGDPCGGTGGNAQILSLGNHTITVKLHNGVREIFSITSQTVIKSSAGLLSETDLKTGTGVTLVIGSKIKDGKRVLMAVVICGAKVRK